MGSQILSKIPNESKITEEFSKNPIQFLFCEVNNNL